MADSGGLQKLIVQEVTLVTEGSPVATPLNLVYSTAPRIAYDENLAVYVVKGEYDRRVVLAEVLGYSFADVVGVPVPGFSVGRFKDDETPHFASHMMDDAQRDVEPWLKKREISNLDALSKIIALGVWLANNDRNMGNLLGKSAESDGFKLQIYAIDFEKSLTVMSDTPLMSIGSLNPKSFWPTGILGKICKEIAPLKSDAYKAIQQITDNQILQIVSAGSGVVGCIDSKRDAVVDILKSRRDKINKLAEAAWN